MNFIRSYYVIVAEGWRYFVSEKRLHSLLFAKGSKEREENGKFPCQDRRRMTVDSFICQPLKLIETLENVAFNFPYYFLNKWRILYLDEANNWFLFYFLLFFFFLDKRRDSIEFPEPFTLEGINLPAKATQVRAFFIWMGNQ